MERAKTRRVARRINIRKTVLSPKVAEKNMHVTSASSMKIFQAVGSNLKTKHLYGLDELDGHEIGRAIIKHFYEWSPMQRKKRSPTECAKYTIGRYAGLKDLVNGLKRDGKQGRRHNWFEPMLSEMLVNKPLRSNLRRRLTCGLFESRTKRVRRKTRQVMQLSVNSVESVQAARMLDKETAVVFGKSLGHALTTSLFTCANAEAAVDEWFIQKPFLKELAMENPWFLPMVTEIAHVLLQRAPWGVKARVGIIFFLNYVNIGLDFYIIHRNLGGGGSGSEAADEGLGCDIDLAGVVSEEVLGYAMLGCYAVQLLAKLSLNKEQNRWVQRDDNAMFFVGEFISTALFFKPVQETYRIIRNSHKG